MQVLFQLLPGILMLQKSLDEEIAHYRQLSFAVSTRKSYSSQLKSYLSFCNDMGCSPVPVSQENLCRYTAFLARRLAPQSIPAYLNIIRLLHLESDRINPLTNNFVLDTLLKGIKRDKGVMVKQALPMTPQILLHIRNILDLSAPYWVSFWAACLVAFFAFLRKSNLFKDSDNKHYLTRDQIVRTPSDQVVLVINSTKTIQYKQRSLILPLPDIPNHPLCPVSALKNMFMASPPQQGSDPVFSFNTPAGIKPLSYTRFIKDLRGLLVRLGLGSDYSGHSFRRGGASYMLQMGIPGEMIKLMGDWRSDCYQRYLDVSLETRTRMVHNVAQNLPKSYS